MTLHMPAIIASSGSIVSPRRFFSAYISPASFADSKSSGKIKRFSRTLSIFFHSFTRLELKLSPT